MSVTNLTGSSLGVTVTQNQFSAIDYGVFSTMLLVSTAIGIYFGYFDGKAKTTEEYLLGGRNMKTIPIAISLIAR